MNTSTIQAMISGALVWSDPKPADAARLRDALELIGLGKFAPNPESADAALQHAMADYGAELVAARKPNTVDKISFMVQARKDKHLFGFELVQVNRKEGPNGYKAECACRVIKDLNIVEILEGSIDIVTCQERFDTYRSQATGTDVGRSLVNLIEHLHGTCVRLGRGGIYYLPENAVPIWDDVVTAFESTGKTQVHCMRVILDAKAAKAIRAGIVAELNREASIIVEELKEGDLKEEVVERRLQRSQELRVKAREYEAILSDTLGEVHAVLDVADACAAAVLSIKESASVFDETFA